MFAAIALPRGGVFHGLSGSLRFRQVERLAVQAVMWGVSAYIVPVPDPDAAATYDALWDTLVPKNVFAGTGVLDLDTVAVDGTPEWEPGEVNWAGVFDMESGPRRVMRKRGLIDASVGGTGPIATGGATHYVPQKTLSINVKGGHRVKVPSALMFAFSNPTIDRTTDTVLTSPTEDEWLMLRYLEDTALDAMKFLIGRTEAGATTPYTEASAFLQKTLAPPVFEETAAEFASGQYFGTFSGKFTMSVPGTMKAKLDGDR